MAISTQQARAQFTSEITQIFEDRIMPTDLFRSYFPTVQVFTKYVSTQVRRFYENVAIDVRRGTEGNMNKIAKQSEKVYEPPMFAELIDLTQVDLYDRLFGSSAIDAGVYAQFRQNALMAMEVIQAKIERAIEIMCSQAMTTGVVTMTNQDTLTFPRQAGSLIAADPSTIFLNAMDPFAFIETGANFLRQQGKTMDVEFDLIMGSQAWNDLQSNAIYIQRVFQTLNNSINTINQPGRTMNGASAHGVLSIGSYKAQLITYPQSYDVAGTATPYMDPKKVILVPRKPEWNCSFAAVPQVMVNPQAGLTGDFAEASLAAKTYVVDHWPDVPNSAHKMRIRSCPVPILTAIDRVWTAQVCA